MGWKSKVFEFEMSRIKKESHKELLSYLLEEVVPEYFFVIEPSSTGKYHPICTHRRGGLVVHTKRLVFLVGHMSEGCKLSDDDRDILVIAGILHDIGKKDKYSSYEEYGKHPIIGMEMIEKVEDQCLKYVDKANFKNILNLVKFHQGPFGPPEAIKGIEKYDTMELLLYMADLLSANKFIDLPVDNYEVIIPGVTPPPVTETKEEVIGKLD